VTTHRHDRRVRRTRGLLHDALASLIHEKPYDGIVVKEILARANVGRSTFYTHFRDKEELLESSIRDVLDEGKPLSPSRDRDFADQILTRTLHLFEHVERQRVSSNGPQAVRRQALVHEHLYEELVRSITEDLDSGPAALQEVQRTVPRDLIARFVASTFLVVLEWWFESDPSLSATEVNSRLSALVKPALPVGR
jgi:AcrR family transcriptional regulator